MSDFNKDNRPLGEKAKEKGQEVKEDLKGAARRAEGAITGDKEKKREHEPSSVEKAFGAGKDSCKDAKEGAKGVKEDLKGAARRAEGELRNDEGLKQEHDPSMLERAGEALSNAAEYAKDTVVAGAQKVGLIAEDTTTTTKK